MSDLRFTALIIWDLFTDAAFELDGEFTEDYEETDLYQQCEDFSGNVDFTNDVRTETLSKSHRLKDKRDSDI